MSRKITYQTVVLLVAIALLVGMLPAAALAAPTGIFTLTKSVNRPIAE